MHSKINKATSFLVERENNQVYYSAIDNNATASGLMSLQSMRSKAAYPVAFSFAYNSDRTFKLRGWRSKNHT